jgi:hypothetical protein
LEAPGGGEGIREAGWVDARDGVEGVVGEWFFSRSGRFQSETGGDQTNPFLSKEKNRGTTVRRHRPAFEPIGGGM